MCKEEGKKKSLTSCPFIVLANVWSVIGDRDGAYVGGRFHGPNLLGGRIGVLLDEAPIV